MDTLACAIWRGMDIRLVVLKVVVAAQQANIQNLTGVNSYIFLLCVCSMSLEEVFKHFNPQFFNQFCIVFRLEGSVR